MTVNVISDNTVRVRIKGQHTNHGQSRPYERRGIDYTGRTSITDPRSAQSMSESRTPQGVREWIEERVAERMDAQAIYEHVAISEATIEKVVFIGKSVVRSSHGFRLPVRIVQ